MNEKPQKLAPEPDGYSSDQPSFTSIDSLPVTNEMPKRVKESVYEIPEAASGKDVYSCRAALWGLMFIMSTAGILAVFLHHKKHYVDPIELSKLKSEFLESQKESEDGEQKLEQGLYSANIEKIAARCSKMVSKENSFAIFENGTCVLVLEPIQDPVVSAKSSLQILADPNTPFHVKPMNNNNYLVIFNKYIFCWLFAEDIAKVKEAILEDSRLSAKRPNANTKMKMSPFEQRLGKLARLLMIKDSKDLELKELMRLDSRQQAGGPSSSGVPSAPSQISAPSMSLQNRRNENSAPSLSLDSNIEPNR